MRLVNELHVLYEKLAMARYVIIVQQKTASKPIAIISRDFKIRKKELLLLRLLYAKYEFVFELNLFLSLQDLVHSEVT